MLFTQYFYKRTVASLYHANNRLVKRPSIHFASTTYSSHIWFTHRPQLSFQFSMIWIRLSLDWHHVFWFTIHWNILLFVYYGQDTWASTSVLPCLLQRMRPECMRIMERWRIDRRPGAAVRWGQKPAKSCHILRVDRFPSWMSSTSITLHTSHYSSSSSFYVFYLQARTDVRTATPNCCDEPWSVTRYTPYPTFASCAGFPASDTSFTEHRSRPKHVSEQTIW